MCRSTRSLFHHLNNSSSDAPIGLGAVSSIIPSLRAAQSTSRFVGDKQTAERTRWRPVDYEIMALLQDHLFYIETSSGEKGGATTDAWTEGNAACDLLQGMTPVAMGNR